NNSKAYGLTPRRSRTILSLSVWRRILPTIHWRWRPYALPHILVTIRRRPILFSRPLPPSGQASRSIADTTPRQAALTELAILTDYSIPSSHFSTRTGRAWGKVDAE